MATTDAVSHISLSETDIDQLPNWGFAHFRFIDLGHCDIDHPFVIVPEVSLPPGWRTKGTIQTDGHLWRVITNLPFLLSDGQPAPSSFAHA